MNLKSFLISFSGWSKCRIELASARKDRRRANPIRRIRHSVVNKNLSVRLRTFFKQHSQAFRNIRRTDQNPSSDRKSFPDSVRAQKGSPPVEVHQKRRNDFFQRRHRKWRRKMRQSRSDRKRHPRKKRSTHSRSRSRRPRHRRWTRNPRSCLFDSGSVSSIWIDGLPDPRQAILLRQRPPFERDEGAQDVGDLRKRSSAATCRRSSDAASWRQAVRISWNSSSGGSQTNLARDDKRRWKPAMPSPSGNFNWVFYWRDSLRQIYW